MKLPKPITPAQRRRCLNALVRADTAIQSAEKNMIEAVAHHLILDATRLLEIKKES